MHIAGFAFEPAAVHVLPGTTVTWDNHDHAHPTVTLDGSFDPGLLGQGDKYHRTFASPGAYACDGALHASMVGQVVVTAWLPLPL